MGGPERIKVKGEGSRVGRGTSTGPKWTAQSDDNGGSWEEMRL